MTTRINPVLHEYTNGKKETEKSRTAHLERAYNDLMDAEFKILALQEKMNQELRDKTKLKLYIADLEKENGRRNRKK